MPDYVTPTSHARQRGQPVKQLGSLEAVIAALPDQAWMIVADYRAGVRAAGMILSTGARKTVRFAYAYEGPAGLYEIPAGAVVGVEPDAFASTPSAMWADMQKILSTRFKEVHWG